MNPILYAFLSENFKKSFLKVCPCTKAKQVPQFKLENSVGMKKLLNRHTNESSQPTRDKKMCMELTTTVTTTTGTSNLPLHSPPTNEPIRRMNGTTQHSSDENSQYNSNEM